MHERAIKGVLEQRRMFKQATITPAIPRRAGTRPFPKQGRSERGGEAYPYGTLSLRTMRERS